MNENWLDVLSNQTRIAEITKCNEYSEKFGLILSDTDIKLIVAERKRALRKQQRVEFGSGIIPKLIFAFCDSDFIEQEHYTDILIQLQDIFYLYKNEMMDEITDDELIHFMKEQFENVCFGDLDYLSGTCLEIFSQAIRAGYSEHQDSEGYSSFRHLDIVPRWNYELYLEALKNQF